MLFHDSVAIIVMRSLLACVLEFSKSAVVSRACLADKVNCIRSHSDLSCAFSYYSHHHLLLVEGARTNMYSSKYRNPIMSLWTKPPIFLGTSILCSCYSLSLLHNCCGSSQIVVCLDACVYFYYDHAWERPSWLGLRHSKFVDYCPWMISPITSPQEITRQNIHTLLLTRYFFYCFLFPPLCCLFFVIVVLLLYLVWLIICL